MVHQIWYTKNERVQLWLTSLIARLPIPLEGGLARDVPIAVRTINLSLGQNLKSSRGGPCTRDEPIAVRTINLSLGQNLSSVPSKIMFPCMYHKFGVQDIISRSIPYKNCDTT